MSVKALLPSSEAEKDQKEWYDPKMADNEDFVRWVEKWKTEVQLRTLFTTRDIEEVNPEDSISQASSKVYSQQSKRSGGSSTSARLHLQAEQAALLVRASTLKKKQALEKEEAMLKARREELELEAEMAANSARLHVFSEFESSSGWECKGQAME
ncbi:hypothetical protein DPEC_G00204720 [Dallia pectoralis]|uniref:Uncharacterized protein n=1 Tax=Dallia pectoralis TaxID=75939 RepID=A0ACC2G4E8_DALPE|nr:hypothetical protein DPEC_G00204720 [Dallia pectoralis]